MNNEKANEQLVKDQKTINNIINNYIQNEKSIVNQLYFKTIHGPTIGGFREDIWREMFEQIVPKKFTVEQSVFLIDSNGGVSKEVDLAIFDEMYTPYIFRYGRMKFLPIEAVAVVVQCKSTSFNSKELNEWSDSIADLQTSSRSYTRIAGKIIKGEEIQKNSTQTATRPLRILCCLPQTAEMEKDKSVELFDAVIYALKDKEKLKVKFDRQKESLQQWYLALNHVNLKPDQEEKIEKGSDLAKVKMESYKVTNQGKEVSLLSFNLQLNQLLMLINNPILFPHQAYVEMFNNATSEEGKDDEADCSTFH